MLVSSRSRAGFTLLEVLLAAVLLAVGVGALLGSAAITIRTVGRGRQIARATAVGASELERLRARLAASGCAGAESGADSMPGGISWVWQARPAGLLEEVGVVLSIPVAGGSTVDSLTTAVRCVR